MIRDLSTVEAGSCLTTVGALRTTTVALTAPINSLAYYLPSLPVCHVCGVLLYILSVERRAFDLQN